MSKKSGKKVQAHIYFKISKGEEAMFLLLQKAPSRGGYWQPVTGNVKKGEDIQTCLEREIHEETGISELLQSTQVDEFRYEKNGQEFHEVVFLAEVRRSKIRLSKEHSDYSWEPYDQARVRMHFESNKQALDKAINLIRSYDS